MNMINASCVPSSADGQSTQPVFRGGYGEIVSVGGRTAQSIIQRFQACLPERFIGFDSKMRGGALNLDLYGYCGKEEVAVVQVRHAFRKRRNHFMNIRKDYVLVGFNEITHAPFRHPVSAMAVRAAVRREPDDAASVVRAAQRWMWEVTPRQLEASLRQGDVLLVPHRGEPAGEVVADETYLLGGSHEVRARKIVLGEDAAVFAWAPAIWHVKGQHDPIYADDDKWYSVRVARAEKTWDWSQRLGD